MKTGIELIADERTRQVAEEGWTPEHDAGHTDGELADAAACYAMTEYERAVSELYHDRRYYLWPFNEESWKPSPNDRIRELVKAGALIAAEIDRLQTTKG